MKSQKIGTKPYSNWEVFRDFLVASIKEQKIQEEKDEQKIISKEINDTVKGKEITLDNICI